MSHIHEKIDFTVSAFLVYGDKVLLRYHDKYNVWLAPGGHVELDEDPIQSLNREIAEETGLAFEIIGEPVQQFNEQGAMMLPAPSFMQRVTTNPGHEHVDLGYVARALTTDIRPAEGEMTDPENFVWLTEQELDDPTRFILDRIKYCAKKALTIAQTYER